MDTENVVADFIIVQRIFRSRKYVRFYFQFVCELNFVFLIIVYEILPVTQVQGAYSSFVPIRRNIILCKLNRAFEVGSPVPSFRNKFGRRRQIAEIRLVFDGN